MLLQEAGVIAVSSKIWGRLGPLYVGDDYPVRIVAVVNVSPESFYKGSVVTDPRALKDYVVKAVEEGCDVVDIGGRSTAPYLKTDIPVEEEVRRVREAIKVVRDSVSVPISVDTFRARVAEEALKLGAEIVNDVTGLKGDPEMIRVLKDYQSSLVICAREVKPQPSLDPVARVVSALRESIEMLLKVDYDLSKVVVDPCIGFFRYPEIPWYIWDLKVLANLGALRSLGRPIMVGVSRKSFIGVTTGREKPEERLYGSLAYTAIALLSGAHVIRTHDVLATRDVVNAISAFKKYGIRLKLYHVEEHYGDKKPSSE